MILLKVELDADPGQIHSGFDPPNLDPASGENDDPSVYWASVVQDSTNNIVNLNIPGGNFSNFEWIKNSGDGATVSHDESATGDSVDLDIDATGSGDAIQVAEFYLVVKQTTQRLITLNVMVLPPRGPISLGVYNIEDSSSPGTKFATSPTVSKANPASVVSMCNDVFHQAGITFLQDPSSGNKSVAYDTHKLEWDPNFGYWNPVPTGPDGKVSTPEYNAIATGEQYPATIDVFFLKNSGNVYFEYINNPDPLFRRGSGGDPTTPEAYLFVSNSQHYINIAAAHEVGHVLGLSVANNANDTGLHDNPPYSNAVVNDVSNLTPPSAPSGHQSSPNAALMQSGSPGANGLLAWPWGRWMRHEDWREANTNANSL